MSVLILYYAASMFRDTRNILSKMSFFIHSKPSVSCIIASRCLICIQFLSEIVNFSLSPRILNLDWVCLVTSPDFEEMYRQTRSFESVPRRGMVTGPRRSGDVPVVEHPPPGSTGFVVTRVLQRLRPCC